MNGPASKLVSQLVQIVVICLVVGLGLGLGVKVFTLIVGDKVECSKSI